MQNSKLSMNEVRNIVLLGRRNAGKSTLANMIAGQEVAIVSPVAGTTTDPVRKRMEIKGVGPCNLIDTAGIDDEGEVGSMRSERSFREADGADLALVLFTGNRFGDYERAVANYLKTKSVPFILVHSKEDVCPLDESLRMTLSDEFGCPIMNVSCNRASDRDLMLSAIARMLNDDGEARALVPKSLAGEGDRVILVCPIDKGAPEGRLILEDQAETTKENFQNIAGMLQADEPVVMISSNYHMDRAVRNAGEAGFTHVMRLPAPSGFFAYGANMLSEVVLDLNDLTK